MLSLLIGLAMMVLCLALQSIFSVACLRKCTRIWHGQPNPQAPVNVIVLFLVVLLLLMLSNFVQTGIWAALFLLLGEFGDFGSAIYFSAVNFFNFGYGDVVMSDRWSALGLIETTNGILMYCFSVVVLTAVIMDVLSHKEEASN